MVGPSPPTHAKKNQPFFVKNGTVDVQHKRRMQQLQANQADVARLEAELAALQAGGEPADGEARARRRHAIQSMRRLVARKQAEEVEYYRDAGDTLFKYYDMLENQAASAAGGAPPPQRPKPPPAKGPGQKNINILSMIFRGGARSPGPTTPSAARPAAAEAEPPRQNKTDLVHSYLKLTDRNFVQDADDTHDDLYCEDCKRRTRQFLPNEGVTMCTRCYRVDKMIVDYDRPSYREPPKEISYFAYKRINHFNEWLNQIQGKETTDISDEVFDRILMELKKQKINNMVSLKPHKVKEILKKLKINKYYEHIPHIINRLSGVPTRTLSPECEEKLRNMFKMIQMPFLKYSPPERKNFLSYAYVLHKFIQLQGMDEYLPSFPLLKSREKLHQQDVIWEKICKELGWQFLKSL